MNRDNPTIEAPTENAPISDKCADRVCGARDSRLADLERFNQGEYDADDNPDGYKPDEDGEPYEYGLCLDFVEAGTFDEQRRGYVRFQFSWGGPSEEVRIYADGSMDFWFLDWGDGASRTLDRAESATVEAFLMLDGYPSVHAWATECLRDYSEDEHAATWNTWEAVY